jgi:hypothetical protein
MRNLNILLIKRIFQSCYINHQSSPFHLCICYADLVPFVISEDRSKGRCSMNRNTLILHTGDCAGNWLLSPHEENAPNEHKLDNFQFLLISKFCKDR